MTSGATESINLAFSLVGPDAEVITSAVEHPAVRENAKRAELAHEVKVNSVGRVDLDDFGGNINAAVDALIDGEAPAMAAKEA